MSKFTQKTRFITLIFYILILLTISKISVGSILPPSTEKGLWFYAGLSSILMGYILVNPFYTPPADSFTNGVAAIISILAVNIIEISQYSTVDKILWWAVLIYSFIILISSAMAIVFKDSRKQSNIKLGKLFTYLSSELGSPKVIFSIIYIFSLIVFHRNDVKEFIPISLAWIVLIGLQPIEKILEIVNRIINIYKEKTIDKTKLGEVVGHQFPNLILIKNIQNEQINFGDPIIVHGDDGKYCVGIALDYIGFAEGRWLRALQLPQDIIEQPNIGNLTPLGAYRINPNDIEEYLGENRCWENRNHLIGMVAPESDSYKLRIDLTRTDVNLEEGGLVEVWINDTPVFYQLINATTKEEILQQKNTRGYVRADARKIGNWNDEKGGFDVVKWVPEPNSPVFIVESEKIDLNTNAVGHFPGTDYFVSVSDINKLVTHNTAILGILGIGKSFLSFELVERIIDKGIKVICLDITNQYQNHLQYFYDLRNETRRISVLQNIGPKGKQNVNLNVEEGGSVNEFKSTIKKYLSRFLNPDCKDKIIILNPVLFEVWKQDSRPYNNQASMMSLSPVEITRIITEATLEILQEEGICEEAKCCIVYEEAHSLIPEWNSTVNEGDKTSSNAIAKAILQGRKYGLGSMVITQRTANVTKSILNQCNTVFAMRIYDSTGMDFLRNFIGNDYSNILSTLDDRHAIFFGKASSCKDPVLIKLNDREDFIKVFRK